MAPPSRETAPKAESKKRKRTVPKPPSTPASHHSASIALTPQTQTYFLDRLYNIPQKLNLSDITKAIFKEYDDVNMGNVDKADFSRKLYLSAGLRASLNDTIIQCTEIMSETPEETGLCVATIKKCTELIKLSNKPYEKRHFPFRKFPSEIRNRIYTITFGSSDCIIYDPSPRPGSVAARTFPRSCPSGSCPTSDYGVSQAFRLDLSIALTCKALSQEVLPLLYREKRLSFSCTCKMLSCLCSDVVRDNVQSLSFHWRGDEARISIPLLMKCPKLNELFVKISASTTHRLTEREEKMAKYFRGNQKIVRLSDASGIEELLQIRGMTAGGVQVSNAPLRSSGKRTEEEIFSLSRLLREELCKPKPMDYGDNVIIPADTQKRR